MSVEEDIQKAIKDHNLYLINDFAPPDWNQAMGQYMPMAEAGDAKAQFNVGYMFAKGDIMDQDYDKALEWYQKAADKGDARAHYNLSQMYERGESVLIDTMKAKELFNRAIELGDIRPKQIIALANAKEALKQGDRSKARALFAISAENYKEAALGLIACDVEFKSIYSLSVNYSYHSSGEGAKKKYWKIAEDINTDIEMSMTNNSDQNWHVWVKGLVRAGDGVYLNSPIGGLLKAKEVQNFPIKLEDFEDGVLCGVEIIDDPEGAVDKPSFKFLFPEIELTPDEEEKSGLHSKLSRMAEEMRSYNKTAKPGGCFVLTACYGSYDAPTVFVFRQFRDNHLSHSAIGRVFIRGYYKYGPSWAEAISNKPLIKKVLRILFNQLAKILPQ